MLHTFKIRLFFIVCFCFFLQAYAEEGKYYCRADKDFKNYQSGFIKDLSLVKGFDSKETCENNCFIKKTCEIIPQKTKSVSFVNSKNIDLSSIKNILKEKRGEAQGLEVLISAGAIIFMGDNPLNIDEIFKNLTPDTLKKTKLKISKTPNVFKISIVDDKEQLMVTIDKNSLIAPAIKANYITRDGKDYTLITKTISNSDGTKKETSETKEGRVDFYQLLGITYTPTQINMVNPKGSITIPLKRVGDNLSGEKIIKYEGSIKNDIKIGNKRISFITQIDGADLKKDIKYIINYNGFQYDNFQINFLIKQGNPHYTCSFKKGLKGDLGDDIFSSKEACNAACNTAITCQLETPKKPFIPEEDCTFEEQLLDGVGDIDGKYIYQTKKIVKTCKKSRKKQIGCELYDYKTTYSPDIANYLKDLPSVETNLQAGDFSKGLSVFAKASAAEQVAHMFSGEDNYCDSGTFEDAPNWAELGIKYAMMIVSASITSSGAGEAYGAAKEGAKKAGDGAIKSTLKGAKAAFNHIPKGLWETTVKNFTKEGFKTMGEQMLKNAIVVAASNAVAGIVKDIKKGIEHSKFIKKYNEWESKYGAAYMSQQASAGANQKGVKSYEELNGAIDEDDAKAAKYASCMTGRFSLYPEDILNYSLGINPDDLDDPEAKKRLENLSFPSKTQVKINPEDLAVLVAAVQDDEANTLEEKRAYMDAHYSIKVEGEKNKEIILLRSLTPEDYRIAAETICGGKEMVKFIRQKYGARFLNPDLKKKPDPYIPPETEVVAPPPPTEDKDEEEKMGLKEMALKAFDMALQSLPFPYNIAASLLKDYIDLYSQGDTCFDEEFAKKRKMKDSKNGEMFAKTNKRIASDLCFKTSSKEIWHYWAVPSLTKDRNHYCCYDQKLTKIFAQGIMEQLGRTLDAENCSNITPADLDNISFNECEDGQNPQKDKCFPKERFNELTETILQGGSIGSDDLLKNIVKSTLHFKEKLEDPAPIDPKDIIDLNKETK